MRRRGVLQCSWRLFLLTHRAAARVTLQELEEVITQTADDRTDDAREVLAALTEQMTAGPTLRRPTAMAPSRYC